MLLVLAMTAAPVDAVAQASARREASALPASSAEPLQPGDAVRLAFWREPTLSGEYPVDETGVVVFPYLGPRDVSTLDPAMLRQRLLDEYAGVLANQAVQIGLLRRVSVLGAVRNPGLYRVDATMSITDALALAGGLSPEARHGEIRIQRGAETVRVDLSRATPADLLLRSGDQIMVAERGWLSRNSAALVGATISALGFLLGQAVF